MTVSPRQAQILEGLWNGKTPREMAIALGISDSSVHTHLETLRKKAGAITTIQLCRIMVRTKHLKP